MTTTRAGSRPSAVLVDLGSPAWHSTAAGLAVALFPRDRKR